MAIGTNDPIWKFGTADKISVASTAAVATDGFSVAGDVDSAWTNAENAIEASVELQMQFATMPTVGSILLYARLKGLTSTQDAPIPNSSYDHIYVGEFLIDYSESTATDFTSFIPVIEIPAAKAAQNIEWYILNDGTAQSITAGWDLWIEPKARGIA